MVPQLKKKAAGAREPALIIELCPLPGFGLKQWLEGRCDFHFMILYGDTVSADTDHMLVISLFFLFFWGGGAVFFPSQLENMTEQDNKYILRMESREEMDRLTFVQRGCEAYSPDWFHRH